MTNLADAIKFEVLYAWYGSRYYGGRTLKMTRKGFAKGKTIRSFCPKA